MTAGRLVVNADQARRLRRAILRLIFRSGGAMSSDTAGLRTRVRLTGRRCLDEDAGFHHVGGQAHERADDRTLHRLSHRERSFHQVEGVFRECAQAMKCRPPVADLTVP
jgi:hypothetical protein